MRNAGVAPPVPDRRARLAAEIRAELARQSRSRQDLAAHLGISTDTLRRRLDGVRPFYFDELELVAAFLNVRLSDLTGRTDAA